MADWVYLHDPVTSSHYYADLSTGETCWERPAALDAPRQVAAARVRKRVRRLVRRGRATRVGRRVRGKALRLSAYSCAQYSTLYDTVVCTVVLV